MDTVSSWKSYLFLTNKDAGSSAKSRNSDYCDILGLV